MPHITKWKKILITLYCTVAITPFFIWEFRSVVKNSPSRPFEELSSTFQPLLQPKQVDEESKKEPEIDLAALAEVLNSKAIKDPVYFDYEQDRLVFVHLQKTSGTNLDEGIGLQIIVTEKNRTHKRGCRSRPAASIVHSCKRSDNASWYLSWLEQSFGWQCGLHPGLSDMKSCVENNYGKSSRNIHYISMVRSPIKRYISEWIHSSMTGATWALEDEPLTESRQFFNQFTLKEHLKHCMAKSQTNWALAPIERFVNCSWNLATNRQTRMLALFDSNFSMCKYLQSNEHSSADNTELLRRGIKGLQSLSFFGLTEHLNLSLVLFDRMFNSSLSFANSNTITNRGKRTIHSRRTPLTETTIKRLDKIFLKKLIASTNWTRFYTTMQLASFLKGSNTFI